MPKQEDYLGLIADLFNKFGVRGLTMEQIAARIGVTKRTLYNNFGTKEELLKALIDFKFIKAREELLELASDPKRNAINVLLALMVNSGKSWHEASIVFIQSLQENHPELHKYMSQKSRRLMNEFLALNIPRGRSEGLFRTDFDIDIMATFTHIGISNFVEYTVKDTSLTLDQKKDMVAQVFTIIIRGVLTTKGSEMFDPELEKIKREFLN